MRTETSILLAGVGVGALMWGCDRSGADLLPQPNDKFPAVIEMGELQVLATGTAPDFTPANCNATDENGAYNCYYGQLSPTDGVTQGGATFNFKGTGGNVCVMVDPEALFWNQFIGTTDAAILWGYPDRADDDGDLDIFGGLSTYYTGSPGLEIGDFESYYTDSLGRQIAIDYVECFNESPYFAGEEAHAGRGTPEFCDINTDGREGILYTIVLETFSVPHNDGILAFGTAVVEGRCNNVTSGVQGATGVGECTMMGETMDLDGNVKACSTQLETAFCLNDANSADKVLSSFCCLNPDACGDNPPDDLCRGLDLDAFKAKYPELVDCGG